MQPRHIIFVHIANYWNTQTTAMTFCVVLWYIYTASSVTQQLVSSMAAIVLKAYCSHQSQTSLHSTIV